MPETSPQACMSSFTASLLKRDIDTALGLLSEEAWLFFSNDSVLRKAEFASTMQMAWAVIENYAYSTTEIKWLVLTDSAAVAVYGFEWSGVARGKSVGGRGRATRVFTKRADGWVLTHEHLSNGAAPT